LIKTAWSHELRLHISGLSRYLGLCAHAHISANKESAMALFRARPAGCITGNRTIGQKVNHFDIQRGDRQLLNSLDQRSRSGTRSTNKNPVAGLDLSSSIKRRNQL
jgi:hypothetical protein